jgi:soluble lytic murein transglycosylase-like protein
MDEFIESIPYAETRNYVKRVTMLRSSYARIAQ